MRIAAFIIIVCCLWSTVASAMPLQPESEKQKYSYILKNLIGQTIEVRFDNKKMVGVLTGIEEGGLVLNCGGEEKLVPIKDIRKLKKDKNIKIGLLKGILWGFWVTGIVSVFVFRF
jgi:hypothetical protein